MRNILPVLALATGLVIGVMIGRSRSAEDPARPAAPKSAAATGPDCCEPSSPLQLRQLQQQNEEIRQLKEKLAAAEKAAGPGPGAAPIDRKARAKEIFEAFKRAMKGQEGPELIQALGTLNELDPGMTATLIEQYRAGIEDDALRDIGIMLILIAGGPDASGFIVEKLADPNTSPKDRSSLLSHLSDRGLLVTRKLPYSPDLARSTEGLLRSAQTEDRQAGAGLLGGDDSDNARVRLLRMAESDADPGVRAAAIGSLGWNGDRTSLASLKAMKQRLPADAHEAIDRAIRQLERKFPD